MHTFQFCRYLRETPRRAHISPKEDWNISGKNCWKLICFSITEIRLREISPRKMVLASNFLKIKNPSMIQLNRIQLSSQTPDHVEITKILSTSQRASRIIDY